MNSIKRTSSFWLVFLYLASFVASNFTLDFKSNLAFGSTLSEVVPFFSGFQVHRYTLDNGLKLLVVEDHSSPTFAYQTWYQVGSRNEVKGRTGLAHLFEHMMFKETKNLKDGEFDRLLEGAGAEGENAFTSRDYTAYVQEMPKDKLELIVKAESDRMVNLVINQKSYDTEREVVQNERRFSNENNPDGLINQEIFGLAFVKHPYHWPVIGYHEDLEKMSVNDALQFYRSHYSPNHATVVAVGDLDPKQVLTTVEKYYGNLPSQTLIEHTITQEPQQTAPREKSLKLNIQVEKLRMGYPIPGMSHPDITALDLLQSILTDGSSSRLHKALVETGIASSVGAEDLEDKDPSLFMFMVNLQKNRKAKEAEGVILNELAKLKKQPVSDTELQRAKNKVEFGFYEGLGSNSDKAQFLGSYQTVAGDFQEGIRQHQKIPTITALEVQAAAVKYFNPKTRTVIRGVKK